MEILFIRKWVSSWLCVFCRAFFLSNYMAFMIKKNKIEKMALSKRRRTLIKKLIKLTTCQLKGSCKKGVKRYFLSINQNQETSLYLFIYYFFSSIVKTTKDFGPVWQSILNTYFQFLNNITCIFTHYFTHTYFKKIQIILLKLFYQMDP